MALPRSNINQLKRLRNFNVTIDRGSQNRNRWFTW